MGHYENEPTYKGANMTESEERIMGKLSTIMDDIRDCIDNLEDDDIGLELELLRSYYHTARVQTKLTIKIRNEYNG